MNYVSSTDKLKYFMLFQDSPTLEHKMSQAVPSNLY